MSIHLQITQHLYETLRTFINNLGSLDDFVQWSRPTVNMGSPQYRSWYQHVGHIRQHSLLKILRYSSPPLPVDRGIIHYHIKHKGISHDSNQARHFGPPPCRQEKERKYTTERRKQPLQNHQGTSWTKSRAAGFLPTPFKIKIHSQDGLLKDVAKSKSD